MYSVKKYRLIFVLFCQFLFGAVFAQNTNLKFKHINIEDGLSQSNVICIVQDKLGFMWFGTRDGLNRYDGYKFKIYRNNPHDNTSLSNNYIQSLYEDPAGNLWIGTIGGGLDLYDRSNDNFKSYKADKNDKNAISSNYINCIKEDRFGVLWAGTTDGLNAFNKKTGKFTQFLNNKNDRRSISDDNISDICEDSGGAIWFATFHGGLNLFDPKTRTFSYYRHSDKDNTSIASDHLWRMYEDQKHRLWIANRGEGLDLFDKTTKKFKHFKHDEKNANSLSNNTILSINESNGELWIGTENGGLTVFNYDKGAFAKMQKDDIDNTSINNNSIHSIYKDKEGDMWLGTFNGGINLYNKNANIFTHYKHTSSASSINNNFILSLLEDSKGNFWVGTDGGGLNHFDRKTGKFYSYVNNPKNPNSICGNYVLAIKEDNEGKIWLGTWGNGLSIFDPVKKTFKAYKNVPDDTTSLSGNNIFSITEDKSKNIWVGTFNDGLNVFNRATGKFTRYKKDVSNPHSFNSEFVYTVFCDSKSNIWAGTYDGGLSRFDKATGYFKTYTHTKDPKSISNNAVVSVFEDSKGNLWAGTFAGLNLFEPKTGTFKVYRIKDGLPGESIFAILEDKLGKLWLSTNKGISEFNPVKGTFKNYSVDQGIQAEEFKPNSACKSKDGSLFFGGINGFNEFDPQQVKEVIRPPVVVFTDFQIFNKNVAIAKDATDPSPLKKDISEVNALKLSYKQTVFSLEFAALEFTFQKRIQFAYKLEGFDKEWNRAGNARTTTYTNLDPGDYTFIVKAANGGSWSKQISLKITITPPFWATWWFRTLAVLTIVGGAWGYYRYRIHVIKAQKQALEEQVARRTSEIKYKSEELAAQAEQLNLQAASLKVINEELQEERSKAEKASQAKSVFLATMSHEIRTPMNGVIGMASLLAETPLSSEQDDYVNTIRTSGDALLAVINDILDFSKIESGKMEIDNYTFNLRACLEDVIDLFGGKAAEQGIELLYEIDPSVPIQIIGDGLRLRQILINLVNNALKFTRKGEVLITISLTKAVSGHLELKFDVKDTGIGIAQEKLSKLFVAFSQVDGSNTRQYGGTGLGLVISERLVKIMGGSIGVVSELGQGTTFSFSIMTTAAEADDQLAGLTFFGAKHKRVLLVDGNRTNLQILKNQLTSWDLVPTLAFSGTQALELLKHQPDFALVITDMQMPEIDGISLARSIKAKFPELPVVLMNNKRDDTLSKYPTLFSAVLIKPLKQSQLFKAMQAEINKDSKVITLPEQKRPSLLTEDFAARYPLTILLAEDNLINQKLVLRVLDKLGYHPDIANNGHQALDMFKKTPYQLILMDVLMPEMDGLQATRYIRKNSINQPVIIAMTANVLPEDRKECLEAGMDDFITKPMELESFVALLKKFAVNTLKAPILP